MKQVNVKIPESLDDITLATWQEIIKLSQQEGLDMDFYARRIIKLVYGFEMDAYDYIGARDVEVMQQAVAQVMQEGAGGVVTRFELNGIKYGLIPNFDNMLFGEFADIESYTEPGDYHKLMSILYRPVTKTQGRRYKIQKYRGSHEGLAGMPAGIALGAVAFFLRIGNSLSNATMHSLGAEEVAAWRKHNSQNGGAGIAAYTI